MTFPPSRAEHAETEIHRDDDDEMVAEETPTDFRAGIPGVPRAEPVPQADLVIVDNVATYKGIGVTLEDKDVEAIQGVILQCAYRQHVAKGKALKASLKGLKSPVPRKRRVKKAKPA
jgi:hypothetical protein